MSNISRVDIQNIQVAPKPELPKLELKQFQQTNLTPNYNDKAFETPSNVLYTSTVISSSYNNGGSVSNRLNQNYDSFKP